MVKKPSFVSEDGVMHHDYVKCLKQDIMLWLNKVGENEVGARKIVEALDLPSLTNLINHLQEIKSEMMEPSKFQIVRVEEDGSLQPFTDILTQISVQASKPVQKAESDTPQVQETVTIVG